MSPEDGKRYVEQQRKIERDAQDSAEKLSGVDFAHMPPEVRQIWEAYRNYTPERAREETRIEVLQAQLVGESLPLSFIAQLDLAALASQPGFDPDLPTHGRLLLFYDLFEGEPYSRVGFRLIWDETPAASLRRAPVPEALQKLNHPDWRVLLRPARVTPRSVVTPISAFEKAWDAIPIDDSLYEYPKAGKGPYWAYYFWRSRFGRWGNGPAGR